MGREGIARNAMGGAGPQRAGCRGTTPDLERPQTARERKSAIVGSVWGFDRLGFLGLGFIV